MIFYELEPLKAMEMYYNEKTDGIAPEVIAECEKKNGYKMPSKVRHFVEKYYNMSINKGTVLVYHPEKMHKVYVAVKNLITLGDTIKEQVAEEDILIIGFAENMLMGIKPNTYDLRIVNGIIDGEEVNWVSTDLNFTGMMAFMFYSLLNREMDISTYSDDLIDMAFREFHLVSQNFRATMGSVRHLSISFDKSNGSFIVGSFNADGDKLIRLDIASPKK